MERPVEVAVFDRGELQSVRVLSRSRERAAGLLAGAAGAALVVLAMAGAAAVLSLLGLVVHAPTFFVAWLSVATAVGIVSAQRVRARHSRYRLGADIEADAFAMAEVELLRRSGDDYLVGLVPGMLGVFEHARSSVPVEALTSHGMVSVPLPPEAKVRVEVGMFTFVIARRPEGSIGAAYGVVASLRDRLAILGSDAWNRLVRSAALGTPIAALITFFGSVPAALAVTDFDGRWAIPSYATPMQVEQLIRAKAQFQSSLLHPCFDVMPPSCQRSGYVGVGLSLAKNGEILSHWVSRSSYGDECPVTTCMENVVAKWAFEPMNDRMTLVIPIQVKRTRKPLAATDSVIFVSPDAGDSDSGCADSDSGRPLL